ncbi:MAG: EAL domain-containing protein [Pseudomonadota bacterium]
MNVLAPNPASPSDPLSSAVAERDKDVVAMVEYAIATKSVEIAYQPVVVAKQTGRLAFFEGLARILDATGRAIPAREFVYDIEDKELGRKVDCISLECGLRALAEHPRLRLSINMSARTIGYPEWLRTLDAGVGVSPDIGERLIIEITESSVLAAPETVSAFMAELQAMGICFAVDDFGAGFTSLRHLRDLDFDILKIDGHFVDGLHGDPDNQALVKSMLSIAQHFGMLTVAENVEQKADAEWLAASGVDCLQGYFFGAPALRPDWGDSDNLGALG